MIVREFFDGNFLGYFSNLIRDLRSELVPKILLVDVCLEQANQGENLLFLKLLVHYS